MRLTQLRDFLAIAEHRSLRAAARTLGVAQPSLTKSIQALEKELGAPLFERTSRGATLTPAGAAFKTRCETILSDVRRAEEEVRQLTSGDGGQVAFAITTAPALLFLSRILEDFQRRFPSVGVRIVTANFPTAVPHLRAGSLDFALLPQPEASLGEEFVVEPLLKNARVPVCRKAHPLVNAKSLADLIDSRWLTTSIDPNPRSAFDGIFLQHGLQPPRQVITCEMTTALVELLIHQDTICWLPRAWTETDLLSPYLTAIPIQEPPVQGQDICLVQRRNLPLTPAAEHLADLIRRQCAYRNGQL